ncbi:MAG: hypothetical protein K2G64_05250 [Muribaculaceae bacterium]|nr:hypothetical protein [Muribaculaceae bacterium]MDE5968497.1 hypothetical protein [Muribaculaceae bacterium]
MKTIRFILAVILPALVVACSHKGQSTSASHDSILKLKIDSLIPYYTERLRIDTISEMQRQEIICEILSRAEMLRSSGDTIMADYFLSAVSPDK